MQMILCFLHIHSFKAECLMQATKGIDLFVNLDKIEFMYFNQNGSISSFNGKPLKFVYQFIYLGSNISSTEIDVIDKA